MTPDPSLISVIIPHMNQPEALGVGLAALAAQVGVRRRVEIIVVDNGSRVMPHEVVGRWPGVTLLHEPVPGPGPARNLGVSRASGAILAFIDADCRADLGWLRAIETAFEDVGTTVIGGDVRVGYATEGKPTFLEPYEAIYSYRNDQHIRDGFSGAGNLAMRREVFDTVGPFAGIDVSEDQNWGLRAKALGHAARYVPEMIVYHPARPTFEDLARKWDRHMSHEFALLQGARGTAFWTIKMLAMALSPLAEIPTVMTSPRVSGGRERVLAFACLSRVRLYRARRMAGMLLSTSKAQAARRWNRD
jgi:GT2 family glycosyltransferase